MDEIFARATARPSLFVFAHPDDETVALGARLGRFRSATLVTVTDGAPRNEDDSRAHGFASLDEYRRARREELQGALRLAEFDGEALCFDIPDQEASHHLVEISRRLRELLRRMRPEVVFTHPYEGGHPDHDACAFAVHRAGAPTIVEAAFYHAGPQGIETGRFLVPPWFTYQLSDSEADAKRALFACFPSQRETLSNFDPRSESFRIAPEYDFHRPPHPGRVFYESFNWGMTAERFCELARKADRAL